MSLTGLKERYFLGQERSYRFRLLSLCMNVDYLCNWSWALLFTVYLCLHHPFTWHQSQYWNAADVYHQHRPLRSTRESTVWPGTTFKLQSKDTNTLHHTFPSAFPLVRNQPPSVILIPFHCCRTRSRSWVHVSSSGFNHSCTDVSQSRWG